MFNEDLGEWFGKGPKGSATGGGWDRYSTTGKKLGKCGDRKPGEGKPKCLSKRAAAKLRAKGGAKEIGRAVKRKKRKDPNPERKGKPKNVSTESLFRNYIIFIESIISEKNEPTNKKLWASAKAAASRKYKIKNSAYKNGYAVQWYNNKGGGWKTVNESNQHTDIQVKMFRRPATILIKHLTGETYLYKIPEEHHLDYYYDLYRGKLQRNPNKLIDILKRDKIPVEREDIRENKSRHKVLNEIMGSFDDNFPSDKPKQIKRSSKPKTVPKMHADEIEDMQSSHKKAEDDIAEELFKIWRRS